MRSVVVIGSVVVLTSGVCVGQPDPEPLDWKALEAPVLTEHVELTDRETFLKAGEAYFSPDGEWIIFQAVLAPEAGESASKHYSMFVARLARDSRGAITGLETPIEISPEGSANTCGWFHPTRRGVVMLGSTLVEPNETEAPGYERLGGRYKWAFPSEMEVTTVRVPEMLGEPVAGERPIPTPLFERAGYDAEGSWSADGRFVLYAHVDEAKSRLIGRPEADIWIFDTRTKEHYALVTAPGYDGGPFFSPDGKSICYRSDRRGDDLLQLYVAELAFNDEGVPVAIKTEHPMTANGHVNWAPFWHPSGAFLVYGTSELGHFNYEVFAVEADTTRPVGELRHVRVTKSNGADVLPVFSPDGRYMMWTGQRGPLGEGDSRPSSQLWIARFDSEALFAGRAIEASP